MFVAEHTKKSFFTALQSKKLEALAKNKRRSFHMQKPSAVLEIKLDVLQYLESEKNQVFIFFTLKMNKKIAIYIPEQKGK